MRNINKLLFVIGALSVAGIGAADAAPSAIASKEYVDSAARAVITSAGDSARRAFTAASADLQAEIDEKQDKFTGGTPGNIVIVDTTGRQGVAGRAITGTVATGSTDLITAGGVADYLTGDNGIMIGTPGAAAVYGLDGQLNERVIASHSTNPDTSGLTTEQRVAELVAGATGANFTQIEEDILDLQNNKQDSLNTIGLNAGFVTGNIVLYGVAGAQAMGNIAITPDTFDATTVLAGLLHPTQ
ncbi:MAG: hypothetical protein FWD33_02840 [Alphaproteobacteria bacterium]|nr:hypothetical protein [Alphaproteobacteria bacterium]